MNMPLNFGHKVEEKSFDTEAIPKDTLVWCLLTLRGFKNSRETNGRYMDIELTVLDNQPYAKRKIWDKVADPFDTNNSEEWRNMGYGTIRRILEATKGATPDNPNSYALNALEELGGLTVPVLVGIEKGNQQYPADKNRAEYLSPYSSVKKIVECFGLLQNGVFTCAKEKPAAAPVQGSLLAGTAAPPPAAMAPPPTAAPAQQQTDPTWLAAQDAAAQAQVSPPPAQQQQGNHITPPQQQQPAAMAPVAQPAGFQQGQPSAQQQAAPNTPPAQNAAPPTTTAAATSPSDAPVATPAQFPASQQAG